MKKITHHARKLLFITKEFFFVKSVPIGVLRGAHAHFTCNQEIVLLRGRLEVTTEDSAGRRKRLLKKTGDSIYIPRLTWGEQKFLTEETEILVLCSEIYDENDYIRNYNEFLSIIKNQV